MAEGSNKGSPTLPHIRRRLHHLTQGHLMQAHAEPVRPSISTPGVRALFNTVLLYLFFLAPTTAKCKKKKGIKNSKFAGAQL